MKPNHPEWKWKIRIVICFLIAGQIFGQGNAFAQIPDCTTGTSMYGIWNDSVGSTSGARPLSEIRSINYATGAIGPLMGGVGFGITKVLNGVTFRGSAGLAVDFITNRFYVMTQMGSLAASSGTSPSGQKDIFTINTVTNTVVRIGTTPNGSGGTPNLNDYHFVKLAISPTGVGYAIGVHRDSAAAEATFNPLIRFTTCATVNCSVITLLGYLQGGPTSRKWELFNGDLAFDNAGNLYFASAGFKRVGTINRYTDARLFRINAANIPVAAGAGTIPMTLMADYNTLDSTVVNGIAFNPAGRMYLATRRYNGVQTSPTGPFVNELYSSSTPGVATLLNPFARVTAGYSIADVASCYFPLIALDDNKIELSGKYSGGATRLSWKIKNNNKGVRRFEIQRSDDFTVNYTTIGTIDAVNTDEANQTYTFNDPNQEFGTKKFYRIREVFYDGRGLYSNVVIINNTELLYFSVTPRPNPFTSEISVEIKLLQALPVQVRILDASGRITYQRGYSGIKGINKLNLNGLESLKTGLYFLEISAGTETLHEKIMKK